MGVARTLTGMLATSVLLCAGNLCINASKSHGKITYISVTVTFLIEALKFALCALAIVATRAPVPPRLSVRESLFYAVPSFLYMIDNNLTYVILRFVDPATLSVLWNLKILTTAVLFRFVLKRRLSEIRKIAIALLLLGVVTSQSDHIKVTQLSSSAAKNETTMAMDMGGDKDDMDSDASPQGLLLGLVLVLVAVTISSCASVFTEWAFKRKGSCSFLWQNLQLYIYGMLFNGIGLMVESEDISEHGFLHGYNGWTCAVIVVNCVGGISMGVILKYLDNIACVYSHAIAMMLTMLFSILFFSFSPSLEFGCGLSVLLISMYLYHHKIDTTASGGSDDDSDDTSEDGSPTASSSSSGGCHNEQRKHRSTPIVLATAIDTPSLIPPGLHIKKKQPYEKVPSDSEHSHA